MRALLLLLGKVLLTAGFLAWVFSDVDFGATILSRPGAVRIEWLLAGMIPGGLAVALTAWRFGLFLSAQGIRVPFRRLVELTLIGNFFSLASLGGLGGDAARFVLLSREMPGRKIELTTAILMDHLSGFVAMALMFFLLTAGRFEEMGAPSTAGGEVMRFAALYLGGGLLLVVVGFVIMSPWVHGRVHRDGRWIRWRFMRTFPEAWDRYRRKWRHALGGVGLSCVMLLFYYLTFWLGARAVGCEVSAGMLFAAMPAIDGISALPVSISGLGVREKLFEVLLADLAGIPGEAAVSASLAGFLLHTAWSLLGAVLFFRGRQAGTLREMRSTSV